MPSDGDFKTDTLQVCAGFVTVRSKTLKTANLFYSDELADTGIEQELVCMFVTVRET